MSVHSAPVMAYRWVTFLLAGGYCLYQLLSSDYSSPGGPFRFLTIWALFLSFYSASRMLAISEHRIVRNHHRTASVAAVVNVMVVFLYWKLFFTDPALVNGGGPIPWHQQYYLHALGPALQIFDALFIAKVFARPLRSLASLLAFIGTYILWSELFVQTYNTAPSGSVTNGLPYPFLNSMELSDRLGFYAGNVATAIAVLATFAALSWIMRRLAVGSPSQPAPQ